MDTQTITLAGKTYRLEYNFNAIADFMRLIGSDELGSLAVLDKLTLSQLRSLVYAGVKEGERIEGHDFPMSELDFGAILDSRSAVIAEKAFAESAKSVFSTEEPEQKKTQKQMAIPRTATLQH